MSATDIHGLMDDAMTDPALAHSFRADPEAVLDEYDLTEEEREVLLRGDQNEIRYLLEDEVDGPEAAFRDLIITS